MSHMELSMDTHIFQAFLGFKTSILVDEKDKKRFLDFALQTQWGSDLSVLAFVVLDNEVHFLLGLREEKEEENAVFDMLKRCVTFLEGEYFRDRSNEIEMQWEEIKNREKVLEICKKIHMLPVERGYVYRAGDYWWSSFQAYRGTYPWNGVDILPILRYYTDDVEKSRILFLRYYRKNPNRF